MKKSFAHVTGQQGDTQIVQMLWLIIATCLSRMSAHPRYQKWNENLKKNVRRKAA
jgi:hypothetical protein